MSSRTDLPGDTDRRTRGLQPETLTATEARQGNRGFPVLIVLLGGLILAMLVWIPAEWWGNSIESEGQNPAQTETAPQPAESSQEQNMPLSNPTPGQ
ncbi:hypothetical protein [Rhizobium sp. CECT 9324]|uniref:hypothetical protein n=1 Tax=Rhizobium sp. CECT 9324 TaxID=2845820 RepID=UPI001E51D2CE|nr:hypothetical protein [Rhizobium sp. CECT 9324]CAH0339018.1 hypothetical protein RHI9324_00656 [Rhizobium sp. CECT 9324]